MHAVMEEIMEQHGGERADGQWRHGQTISLGLTGSCSGEEVARGRERRRRAAAVRSPTARMSRRWSHQGKRNKLPHSQLFSIAAGDEDCIVSVHINASPREKPRFAMRAQLPFGCATALTARQLAQGFLNCCPVRSINRLLGVEVLTKEGAVRKKKSVLAPQGTYAIPNGCVAAVLGICRCCQSPLILSLCFPCISLIGCRELTV
eukprot:2155780-Rhodomonas_salina.2